MSLIGKIVLVIWLIANVVVFFMYGADKKKAKAGAWRTPEATLMMGAVFGIFGAILGMKVFRHKTKHPKFTIGVPAIFVVELLICGFLLWKGILPF